jgi:hypothetical protein
MSGFEVEINKDGKVDFTVEQKNKILKAQKKRVSMKEIKFHKNEIDYIKIAVKSSIFLGDDEKLGEKILKKLKQK